MTNDPRQSRIPRLKEILLIAFAFGLWLFMFRDYLSSKMALQDDAISYYDHVRFYLLNMQMGVFPFWDPIWCAGVANNFFLQRIGCFNPFVFLTSLFNMVGISYLHSYLLYLASYYFVGCIGFYLLAKRFLRDDLAAFGAFAIFLFSSIGTRIFDSYLVLIIVPVVWFFYFLMVFSRELRRYAFIGIVFTIILLLTTYIPFYFLLILLTFFLFYGLMYGKEVPSLLGRYWEFFLKNKILVGACAVVLLASMVPGYMFFKSAGSGSEFVMPTRNLNKEEGSILAVQRQDTKSSWSVLEEVVFSGYYNSDLTQIRFAIIFIPLFAYVVFFLGFPTRIERSTMFLFLWGVGLILMISPVLTPVYGFLYRHIFFFKYFRNLHFLVWLLLLPMFCLFIGAQLKAVMAWRPQTRWQRNWALVYVSVIHAGMATAMYLYQFPVTTTYVALALSYGVCVWWLFGSLRASACSVALVFVLVTAADSAGAYYLMSKNTRPYSPSSYWYNAIDLNFRYLRAGDDMDLPLLNDPSADTAPALRVPGSVYYATKWYGLLTAKIDPDILKKYKKHKFVLYDQVSPLNDADIDYKAFETSLAENRNVAFAATDSRDVLGVKSSARHSYYAQPLDGDSAIFKVTDYNANRIKFRTEFTEPKFIVYNDSYHSQWQATIDGHPLTIVRANIGFKGAWIPAGPHAVEFTFGSSFLRGIYLFLFISINAMFLALVFFGVAKAGRIR